MKSLNINYLPAIDHLRGMAALLILFYHGQHFISRDFAFGDKVPDGYWLKTTNPISSLFIEGHTAVALFMVLSGFIFTYGAYDKSMNYWGFIRNRLFRIYPMFLLLMVVGIYAYPGNFNFIGMLQTLFFLSNAQGSLNLGEFSAMFWTISVEFLFYLIFPFLLRMMRNEGAKKMLLLIVVAIVFRTLAMLFGSNIRELSYWTIVGRIDQFIIGMLAAKVFIELKLSRKSWFLIFCASAVLVITELFAFNRLGGWQISANWKVIWPTTEGTLWAVFIVSYVKVFSENKNIIQKSLSRIGEISFSIYLIHYIIVKLVIYRHWTISFSSNAFRDGMLNSLILVVPITILISILTYHVVEKPFLKFRGKYLS
ncbi:acyltransferase [Paenibacillus sp. P22]|uniref:acyltransferase family protein n=1 Tax=Paenibacillus sp. P22 TaxID=483908 RepID=UPI00040DE632|nr:acyltransferase [Paenibacillus sp. P22]